MTPNEIISGLLAIARAAHTLQSGIDYEGAMNVRASRDDADKLEAAIDALGTLPGDGDPITRATTALQSFIESTGGSIAVPRDVIAAAGHRRTNPPQDGYAANTIYVVATDSEAKPVIYGSRSTFTPHEDYHVMEAALDFEQAKRLRGQEIQPFKIGQLWMTTIEPVQISHDFYSHRNTWRAAVQRCIDDAPPRTEDTDDKAYWERELKAFDRTFSSLPEERSNGLRLYIPDTVRDRLLAETTIAAQKIVGDAELIANLRECCGFVENGTSEPVTICQDDATREWGLYVGAQSNFAQRRRYHATSFHQVIRVAHAAERQDHEPHAETISHFDHSGDLPPVRK